MTFGNGWDGPKPYASRLGSTPPRPDDLPPEPRSGIIQPRPLLLGDVLGGAFKAVRFAPLTSFGATLVALLVAQLLGSGLGYLIDKETGISLTTSSSVDTGLSGLFSWTTLLGMLLSSLTAVVVQIGLFKATALAVTGERMGPAAALRHMGYRLLPALGLQLMLTAAVVIAVLPSVGLIMLLRRTSSGFAVLTIVGLVVTIPATILALVWVGFRLILASCAVAIEDAGPIRAVKRSWFLTGGGNFWRILGTYLLASFVISMAAGTVTQVFSFAATLLAVQEEGVALAVIAVATNLLSLVLTLPLTSSVLALLYTDARIRREGYDLELSEVMYG